MEVNLTESHLEEVRNLGKEFALEGVLASKYKSKSPIELKEFLIGYQEGLQILKESQKELSPRR